ncbi:MAG: trigger factor [Acidobacteria bacterium]|nr:MAG: trigger factor [Acidobacteriota bacterium]
MKAELIDLSECKKNLDIEIPQEVVDAEITHIAQELARRARVPGFRPGKAPVAVVKTRFRDEIVSEMMQHLMPKYFGDAIDERKLEIVQAPQFEAIDYNSGKPLRFKAVFEVYPKLNVTNYEGIPVEEASAKVEDSEVEAALKKLQEDMAELAPVEDERPVQEGDFAEISYSATIEGSDEPPMVGEKAVAEIGGRTTMKEFTENLLGAKVDEEKTFKVTYRPDYPTQRLAGKTVEYKVKIEGIKTKEIPEINDEFAQRFGEYKTLDELKAKIREDIEKHKREQAQEQTREKLLKWLEDNNEFELPESLVERQLHIRLQRLLRDLSRQGINPQRLDVDWAKIREDQQQQAMRDVKGSLILEYIAEKENINVAEHDVEAEIEKMAAETNRPKEKVKEVLSRDSGLERLRSQIRNKKTLDLLQAKARIVPSFTH